MALQADLVDRALKLPLRDRAELARQLILSLEPADHDPDTEKAWAKEIERRMQQVDRGEVTLFEWRQSVDRIRENLRTRESA